MSEYYKQIREIIFREYKYYGIGIKLERLLYTLGAISSFGVAIDLITSSSRPDTILMLTVLIAGVFFLSSVWCKRKYRLNRKKAIISVIEKLDINIEIINLVIKELEEYIKRMQVFATWFIGVTVTFIVLFITLFANYYFKCLDSLIQMGSDNQIKDWVSKEFFNAEFLDSVLAMGGYLFIMIIVFVLFFYNIFCTIVLAKKEILYFLHDTRYRLLMNENQRKKLEEETLKPNFFRQVNFNDLIK